MEAEAEAEVEATQPAEAEATQPAERTTHSMGTSPMALPEEAGVEAEDGAVADGLTAEEVGTLGVAALRVECERRGLESKRGTKQELKARLLAVLATAPAPASAPAAEAAEDEAVAAEAQEDAAGVLSGEGEAMEEGFEMEEAEGGGSPAREVRRRTLCPARLQPHPHASPTRPACSPMRPGCARPLAGGGGGGADHRGLRRRPGSPQRI